MGAAGGTVTEHSSLRAVSAEPGALRLPRGGGRGAVPGPRAEAESEDSKRELMDPPREVGGAGAAPLAMGQHAQGEPRWVRAVRAPQGSGRGGCGGHWGGAPRRCGAAQGC